jgi:hypothetical protein
MACGIDEADLEGGCAIEFETTIDLRAIASAPVRARLRIDEREWASSAPRGELAFSIGGLEPGTELAAELTLQGLDGQETVTEFVLATASALAPVFLTEVRADPDGPEPDQEYVEIHNASDSPIDVTGFQISDDASRAGDLVRGPAVLPARGYALLVGTAFDPVHPDDDRVPPGIPLFRLDASIGSGGLSNEGEPLFLRDASGRRLSAAPAMTAPGSGICITRIADDPRTGASSAFEPHPEGRCGPGVADRADDAPSR